MSTDLTPIADDIKGYRELDYAIKALKEQQQVYRARIEDALGDDDCGEIDDKPVVTFPFIKSTRFDQKAFKAAHPDLAAEFVTVTQSRRFTVVDA